MYSVLLVDDDRLELETLRNYIDWKKVGIEKVYSARSSRSALACITENEPDIIITDIQMPGMNGTELAKLIREEGYECKIVFLTGYDQFEYAKAAIQVHAEDYLLKPFQAEEVEMLMAKIIEKIKKEQIDSNVKDIAMGYFLERVCDGNLYDLELYSERYFGKKASEVKFTVIAFYKCEDIQKLANIVNPVQCFDRGGMLICLFPERLKPETIFSCIKKAKGNEYRAAACRESVALEKLNGACTVLLSCAETLFLESEKTLLYTDEKVTYLTGVFSDDGAGKRSILNFIRSGEEENAVAELMECLQQYRKNGKDSFIQSCIGLTGYLCERIREDIYSGDLEKPDILQKNSFDEVAEAFCVFIRECISQYQKTQDYHIAGWVKRYMATHYMEVCSAEEMAEKLNISPNYLRRKFKLETGRTILEFLTDIRMKKAGELLRSRNVKVKDVSVKVGYENISYFTQLFSKKYGVTPNEYKKMV